MSFRPTRTRRALSVALVLTSLALVGPPAGPAAASPPVIIGYLSNFDVYNHTDREEHGFEVEIEDVGADDVSYTYRNPHYGSPVSITPTTFSTGHPGVVVRYASAYAAGAWARTTTIGAVEHFGVTLRKTPGAQRFNWLAENPAQPGTLVPYGGTSTNGKPPTLSIPRPALNVVATPAGEVVEQEVVNGEMEPGETMHPDAVWVRRYAASAARDVTLDELLTTQAIVQETIAQSMLDGQFELIDGGGSLADDDPVEATDEASVLIFETYEYTGPYDDSHTPACDGLGGANDCTNFIGPRLATTMSAVDVEPAPACVGPCVSIGSAAVAEGDAGAARTVSFAVTLSQPSTQTVTVGYRVVADTSTRAATAGEDFTAAIGTVKFVPGGTGLTPTTKYVTVKLRADATQENDETFAVVLSNPTGGYQLGRAAGNARVYDDDPVGALTVDIGDASVWEGDTGKTNGVQVGVALSAPVPAGGPSVSVQLVVDGGSATPGSDLKKTAVTRTLTFLPGQYKKVVTLSAVPDNTTEPHETVDLKLQNPTGGLAIGRQDGKVTIMNDD